MGARSNRTLKQKPKVSPALNKKFKKKPCSFCRDKVTYIDYKDVATLRKYISDRGKIRARRSEERRVGKECRRLCRSRWSPYH